MKFYRCLGHRRACAALLAIAGLLFGLFLSSRSDAVWYWLQAPEYRSITGLLEDKSGRLKLGMSHAEVEKIMGLPSNSDREHIWLWLRDEGLLPNGMKWGQAITELGGDRVSGYLLFVDVKLASDYVRYADASPWELYMSKFKCNLATARGVLGPGGLE